MTGEDGVNELQNELARSQWDRVLITVPCSSLPVATPFSARDLDMVFITYMFHRTQHAVDTH